MDERERAERTQRAADYAAWWVIAILAIVATGIALAFKVLA